MKTIKTISKKTILEHSKFLTVEEHVVRFQGGIVIQDWPWVITPDYTIIVPETGEGEILCYRQERYAVKGETFALPGGFLEKDEDPIEGAKRELQEETGYVSNSWVHLGTFSVDANRGCGRANLFLAREIEFAGKTESDDLEGHEQFFLNRKEAEDSLRNGEFKVIGWVTALSLAFQYLESLTAEDRN